MGYHRAGFDLVGVDINPQPRYPFEFVQGDAIEYAWRHGHLFDAIHASPPCDRYTRMAAQHGTQGDHPDLIPPTREVLAALHATYGIPYVIENVELARRDLVDPILLCGEMYGLDVFRHRLFESSAALQAPAHPRHSGRIGDGRFVTMTGSTGGSSRRDGVRHGTKSDWQRASGIDWMTAKEMSEAIPPAYTEHLGRQMLAYIADSAAA